MFLTSEKEHLLLSVIKLAKEAGHAILDVYRHPENLEVMIKKDTSPLTQADLAAHKIIVAGLKALTPDIPILSEEDADISFDERKKWQAYWLVDPLDGTKEFIHRTDEFTVNIAYIVDGHSQMGVIYAPIYDACYFATEGEGAWKQEGEAEPKQIHSRKMEENRGVIAVSRRHSVEKAKAFMDNLPEHVTLPKGSSLKTCVIAEGLADAYPSFGPTSEWDMGAAQCIIEEAGGMMREVDFKARQEDKFRPLRFNQKESLLNPPLLVVGDAAFEWAQFV